MASRTSAATTPRRCGGSRSRVTSIGPSRPSNSPRVARAAPCRRRAGRRSTIRATRRSSGAFCAGFAGRAARHRRGVARLDDPDGEVGSTWHSSHHDLVQRVLDDALGARRLQPRDQIAHRALLDDRVERHPVRRRSAARSSAAAAPAAARARLSRSPRRTFSMMPTRPCASIAAFSSSAMFSSFVRFHGVLERGRVGDQLRVGLEHGVDDPQPVGAQRRAGLGHLDDRVGQRGGLTSVAPHENSTLTVTPCRSK